jgi:predicted RNA-binding protein with RPS1 domain
VLQVGQEDDVFVHGNNADEKKIALSNKRTQPEQSSRVATKYDVNQLVVGTVTQLANFGAFARIEDGIEGLVHVSELSEARISHPRQLVHEGQDLLLRIIRIDPQRRRMGLSLRRALEATDEEVEAALGAEAVELKNQLLALEVEPDEEGGEEPPRQQQATPEPEEAPAETVQAEVAAEAEEPQTAAGLAMSQAFAEAAEAENQASASESDSTATDDVTDEVASTSAGGITTAEDAPDNEATSQIDAEGEAAEASTTETDGDSGDKSSQAS